jgi:hypothetical protein
MNEFDQWAKRGLKVKYYIRYADDFVFFSTDRHQLAEIVRLIVLFLRATLKLELHPNKVSISTGASGVDFLGWVHFPYQRTLRTVTKRRMFKNVQKKPVNPATVQAYVGLMRHGDTYRLRAKLESLSI